MIMATYYRYDSHCHIFTLEFALKEVKNMVHDILHGTYPWHDPSADKALLVTKGKWTDFKELLRQLYELIHAAGSSEEANLNFLQNEEKKAFPEDTLRIIPLMMDIFYMFAYPMNKDEDLKGVAKLQGAEIDPMEYQAAWNEILDDFKDYLKLQQTKKLLTSTDRSNGRIEIALQLIEQERSVKETLSLRRKVLSLSDTKNYYHTDGFNFHLNNLMNLVKTRTNELFPFIAVDPRRPGMVETITSGSFFAGSIHFYGVKLYPRMGYHPQCKPMDAVYKYCNENKLPIIFHCGKGGFPPSTKWKYSDFGNPINFEPIVKKYPNLKIDFAHMGSTDPTFEWADTIVRLVNENENVFSDLSCYTDADELVPMRTYWDNNPKLKTRLMFGTDFDVMYFTDRITMQSYYNGFKSTFNPDELKALMHDNPLRFFSFIPL